MSTGSTPTIPGLLTLFVGPPVIALTVNFFPSGATLTQVLWRVVDAPVGGSVTIELNTQADGSGVGLSATILDGTDFIQVNGSVIIPSNGTLFQRVTAESGQAITLSGDYTVTGAGVTAIEDALTTLGRVKSSLGLTDEDPLRDLLLNECILGASQSMLDWMDRTIIETVATDEKIDSDGSFDIQTEHYPIISVASLTEHDDALVEDTDFEMTERDLERGQIIRISGSLTANWIRGRRIVKITYTHGFATTPESLVKAATAWAIQKYHETIKSGKGWAGLDSKGVDPASAVSFDKDIWTRDIVPAMQPFKRILS